MTDFTFIGMIIGIIVLAFGAIGYFIFNVCFSITLGISSIHKKRKMKGVGYYDCPKSPDGFFDAYVGKYKTDLWRKDYHLIPKGHIRETIEMRLLLSNNKAEDIGLVASVMAAQKEIQKGYRPSVYPNGYLITTNDIWDIVKDKFKKEYCDSLSINTNILIGSQKNVDAIREKEFGKRLDDLEVFI